MAIESELSISGDWQIDIYVKPLELRKTFKVDPAETVAIQGERCEKISDYNPNKPGWLKGVALKGIKAQECTVKGALHPSSLTVTAGPENYSTYYVNGKDYAVELEWGTVGRLPQGAITDNQTVFFSYKYSLQRIDSIGLTADGKSLFFRRGFPEVVTPKPPQLNKGEVLLVNIYIPGHILKLSQENLFPVLENCFPRELATQEVGYAERVLPKTMKKLKGGGKLKVLAWGDSVTAGNFLPNKDKERWQVKFIEQLKVCYPKADIELVTEAWGGRNTNNYFAEPPGAPHNYKEKVLGCKPDLVIMEFVNDAGFNTSKVNARYGKILADMSEIGAELIINTPHYVRPDWMELTSQRDIDNDPREYVKALRAFALKNNIALADVSLRYGRLWRQGIPYLTLMQNNINHPNPSGIKIYADALMGIFL